MLNLIGKLENFMGGVDELDTILGWIAKLEHLMDAVDGILDVAIAY